MSSYLNKTLPKPPFRLNFSDREVAAIRTGAKIMGMEMGELCKDAIVQYLRGIQENKEMFERMNEYEVRLKGATQ